MSNTHKSYQEYHLSLINALVAHLNATPPFNGDDLDELQENFKQNVLQLANPELAPEERSSIGQLVVTTIVSHYPHITPAVPRDLFWYFGGDCMHFLEDHEIAHFQALDEAYHEAAEANQDYATLVSNFSSRSSMDTKLH